MKRDFYHPQKASGSLAGLQGALPLCSTRTRSKSHHPRSVCRPPSQTVPPRTQLPTLTQTKATRLLPFPVCSSETWPSGSLTGIRECGAGADSDKSRRGHPEDPPLMASADCRQHHDSQRGEHRARARTAVTISICLLPGPTRNEVSCQGHAHSAWAGKRVAQRGPVEVGKCGIRYIRTTYHWRCGEWLKHLHEWRCRRLPGRWFRNVSAFREQIDQGLASPLTNVHGRFKVYTPDSDVRNESATQAKHARQS